MGCEIKQTTFAGHPATAFICGSGINPKPKKCAFCDCRDAKSLCDWPVMKRIELPIEEARVGDVWITKQQHHRGKIVQIEAAVDPVVPTFANRYWVLVPGRKDPYPYLRHVGQTFTTERPGTCDKPCCFKHRRHVGPNRDYCMDHCHEQEFKL